MRNTLVIGVMGVLLCCGGLAKATIIDFNSVNPVGTIQVGDNYGLVTLHDSAAVTMIGGNVANVYAYDSSTFNLQGGLTQETLAFHGSSIANMAGGTSNGGFIMYDNSVLNISGGILSGAEMGNSTILNLSGGDFSLPRRPWFYVQNIVNVYGQDLSVVPYGIQDSLASGHWADGTPFQFILGRAQYYNPSPQIVFYEIPEPASMFLFGLGMVIIRRKTAK